MLVLSVGAGCYWLGFGVFFLPLSAEFATSRTKLSLAVSVAQMEGGLLGPIDGYLVDRFGPRKMMFIGIAIMGLGFLWMSQVQTPSLIHDKSYSGSGHLLHLVPMLWSILFLHLEPLSQME